MHWTKTDSGYASTTDLGTFKAVRRPDRRFDLLAPTGEKANTTRLTLEGAKLLAASLFSTLRSETAYTPDTGATSPEATDSPSAAGSSPETSIPAISGGLPQSTKGLSRAYRKALRRLQVSGVPTRGAIHVRTESGQVVPPADVMRCHVVMSGPRPLMSWRPRAEVV